MIQKTLWSKVDQYFIGVLNWNIVLETTLIQLDFSNTIQLGSRRFKQLKWIQKRSHKITIFTISWILGYDIIYS